MDLFFIVVFGFYFLLVLLLIIGWKESFVRMHASASLTARYKKVTVIVPFRNEASGIDKLIHDLISQENMAGLMEVILVDDHSSDNSAEIVTHAISGHDNFRILLLPAGKKGKKQAITLAVAAAAGDIIVTTDADCRLPEKWLSIVHQAFEDPNVNLLFGGVRIEANEKFISKLQALEFCSLVGTGSAAASLGFPMMCNAANLAYRKLCFMEVNGYEGNDGILSGDDEFLLRKIDRRYSGSIYFLPASKAVVTTSPLPDVPSFLNQRRRWASKWKHNDSIVARLLAVFVIVFQAAFLLLWIAPLLDWIDWRFGLLLILFKMFFEIVLLRQVASLLKVKWDWTAFLALQFVYPVYVIFTGLSSILSGYEWKGRASGKG